VWQDLSTLSMSSERLSHVYTGTESFQTVRTEIAWFHSWQVSELVSFVNSTGPKPTRSNVDLLYSKALSFTLELIILLQLRSHIMVMIFTASRRLLMKLQSGTLAQRTSALLSPLHRTPPPPLGFSRNTAVRLVTSSSNGPGGAGGGFINRNKRIIQRGVGSAVVGLGGYTAAHSMQRDKDDWQKEAKVLLLSSTCRPQTTISEELENYRRWETIDEKALSWYVIGLIYLTSMIQFIKAVTQEDRFDKQELLALRELKFSELKQALLERDDVYAVKVVMYHGDVTFEEVSKTMVEEDARSGACLAKIECLTRQGDESKTLTFHTKFDDGIKSYFKLADESLPYDIRTSHFWTPERFIASTIIFTRRGSDLHL